VSGTLILTGNIFITVIMFTSVMIILTVKSKSAIMVVLTLYDYLVNVLEIKNGNTWTKVQYMS